MLYNYNGFQILHPLLRPSKILSNHEKKDVIEYFKYNNSNIPTIFIDDFICRELCAKVGDIICMQDIKSKLYRIVIEKNIK